jgi:hypothetical protein
VCCCVPPPPGGADYIYHLCMSGQLLS